MQVETLLNLMTELERVKIFDYDETLIFKGFARYISQELKKRDVFMLMSSYEVSESASYTIIYLDFSEE